ncbi:MAG: polysaccharide export protein [Gemmatimonadetes bacterium]|nr:polysaccharide export protein [Gemmatimonadota bacterium]
MMPSGLSRVALRRLPAALLVLLLSMMRTSPVRAQDPITGFPGGIPNPATLPPEQARALLASRPDLAQQVRERIAASGMTPEQVRERLVAAGYPEDLLDPYMPGAESTGATVAPTTSTVDALRSLGVVSARGADSMLAKDSTAAIAKEIAQDSVQPKGLQVFGLEVFRRRTREFAPALAGPIDANYVLGPGDLLVLVLTGDVERSQSFEVNREGFILIPQVGQVQVGNLTLGQATDLLFTRLGRVYSGIGREPNARTRFQLSVGKIRAVQIYVSGDVARPGLYQVAGAGSVLSALYSAGGPTARGSFRKIEVRRGSELLGTVDLYDYLLRGINSTNLRVTSGDVVFVPPHGPQVKVTGEVLRPAIYELVPNETLRDLIATAGGFTDQALTTRVQINRVLPPAARGTGGRDRVVVDVSGDQLAQGTVPPYPMEAGDSVVIFPVTRRMRALVTVQGNVWLPGPIGFTPGMKLGDAIRLAGGPKPDVFLGDVLVTRLQPDSTRIQLRSALADSTGLPVNNFPLADDDEITVFSRSEFRSDRYIVITGAVRKPGRQPYSEGMTLRDAALLADGLREDAFLDYAEVARLPRNRESGQMASSIRVPLDSTYVFDRGANGKYLGPPGLPAAASGAPSFVLEPFDNVLIFEQPGWELQRVVALTGQVQFPGRYALVNRNQRLSDLIAQAGGLTKEAYPAGIQFYRRKDNEGRIGIDLPLVLADSGYYDNLILAGGDSIHIPEYNPVVRVSGAVNAPLAVTWAEGKNMDFYVASAGGYSRDADKGRAYVTQPSGKVESVHRRFLLPDGKPVPAAGATIFVPEKDKTKPSGNTLQILATAATIIASLTTIIIVAKQ